MRRRIAGVYLIKNIVSGKVYVGHSVNIKRRWWLHLWQLKHHRHHNIHLQRAWDKHDKTAFVFELVEDVPIQEISDKYYLHDLEQTWMDACQNVYNLHAHARNASGYKLSIETRRRLSIAHLGIKPTDEQKINGANSRAKPYLFISPEGAIVEGKNLAELCRKHDLELSSMCKVLKGEALCHKGWTKDFLHHLIVKRDGSFASSKRFQSKGVKVIDRQGVVHTVHSPYQFAREQGLKPNQFAKLIRGGLKESQGFKVLPNWESEVKPLIVGVL